MKSVAVGSVRVGVPLLLVFAASAVSLVVLTLFLKRTYVGRAIRAVTANRDAALLSGVNADRISAAAFGLGTAFAAMAGSLMSTMYAFTPDFGRSFLLKAFVLALLENVVASYTPIPTTFQDAISFSLLVIVLVLLPQGLPRLFLRFSRRLRPAAR
jgi:branched-subunit amino acid ABC-type transport system permease component